MAGIGKEELNILVKSVKELSLLAAMLHKALKTVKSISVADQLRFQLQSNSQLWLWVDSQRSVLDCDECNLDGHYNKASCHFSNCYVHCGERDECSYIFVGLVHFH